MSTARLSLAPDDGALRAHLDETQWQDTVVAARSTRSVELPMWAEPYARLDEDTPPPAPPTPPRGGMRRHSTDASHLHPERPQVGDGSDADIDPALLEAVGLDGTALGVEIASSQGEAGLLGVVRTDLHTGSAVVRRIRTVPGGGPQSSTLLEGIEVSGFGIERFTDEVMRMVPPGETSVEVAPAAVPMELSTALGAALRRGDEETVAAICGELGVGEPPPIIVSLVHSLRGSLSVAVRSANRSDVSVASWMLADCGWVEVHVDADDIVHHLPRTRSDVRTRLLSDLSARVDSLVRDRVDGSTVDARGDAPAGPSSVTEDGAS